jgi:hypothetical protein
MFPIGNTQAAWTPSERHDVPHREQTARRGCRTSEPIFHQPILNQKSSPSRERRHQCLLPETAMYRVLFAIILLTLALEMSGCTGSLRLGGEVPRVTFFR